MILSLGVRWEFVEVKKDAFAKSRGTYGPDRLVKELRKAGDSIGRGRCASYMNDIGLDSCHNRHRMKSLTNSKNARSIGYPNIFRSEMFPIAPRMGLTSDITYIKTDEGFMYHCMIKDVVSGDVLGGHMSDRMTKELVINAMLAVMPNTNSWKSVSFIAIAAASTHKRHSWICF